MTQIGFGGGATEQQHLINYEYDENGTDELRFAEQM